MILFKHAQELRRRKFQTKRTKGKEVLIDLLETGSRSVILRLACENFDFISSFVRTPSTYYFIIEKTNVNFEFKNFFNLNIKVIHGSLAHACDAMKRIPENFPDSFDNLSHTKCTRAVHSNSFQLIIFS